MNTYNEFLKETKKVVKAADSIAHELKAACDNVGRSIEHLEQVVNRIKDNKLRSDADHVVHKLEEGLEDAYDYFRSVYDELR